MILLGSSSPLVMEVLHLSGDSSLAGDVALEVRKPTFQLLTNQTNNLITDDKLINSVKTITKVKNNFLLSRIGNYSWGRREF